VVVFGGEVGAPAVLCNGCEACVGCGGIVRADDARRVDLDALSTRSGCSVLDCRRFSDQSALALTLEPSAEGKVFLSTTVIEVFLYRGFLQSAHAVERPNAPLPMMSTDDGVSNEEAVDAMMQH
jgi:hypothetical protein